MTPRPEAPYGPFFTERNRPEQLLVAEADGRIAGHLRLASPTPLASNAHVRQVQGLVVDEWARAGEWRGSRCARRSTNNTPARRLYESEGFVVEGVLPGEFLLGGVCTDDVLMGHGLSG